MLYEYELMIADLQIILIGNVKKLVPNFFDFLKKLHKLDIDFRFATYKLEIKREILFEYQLMMPDLYDILVVNVKKLVPTFLDKEKYVFHYEILKIYLRVGLESRIRINIKWIKTHNEFKTYRHTTHTHTRACVRAHTHKHTNTQTHKHTNTHTQQKQKNNHKNRKIWYNLMNSVICGEKNAKFEK